MRTYVRARMRACKFNINKKRGINCTSTANNTNTPSTHALLPSPSPPSSLPPPRPTVDPDDGEDLRDGQDDDGDPGGVPEEELEHEYPALEAHREPHQEDHEAHAGDDEGLPAPEGGHVVEQGGGHGLDHRQLGQRQRSGEI